MDDELQLLGVLLIVESLKTKFDKNSKVYYFMNIIDYLYKTQNDSRDLVSILNITVTNY